ncbi:MAG: hypothetical protein ABI239_11750 [Aquihabitans sp.]
MKWPLLLLLGSTGVIIVALCIFALLIRNRYQHHHRVDPSVPTEAPMSWLADPREPARLHRRLSRVGTATSRVVEDHQPRVRRLRRVEPSPVQAAAVALRAQAVALDRQVNRLAVLTPRARRSELASVSRSVAEVETACTRLVALSSEVLAPRGLALDDPTLLDVTGQVERLAQAHQELLALDDAAGLVRPDDPTVAER